MVSVATSCFRSVARAGSKCGSELFKLAKEEGSIGHGGGKGKCGSML
jgi:hypothetical protein